MSHICASCGKEHKELSPYFMYRLPDSALDRRDDVVFDDKFTCRIGHEEHFISCELEVPFKDDQLDPLGFICWAKVDRHTYESYRAYRASEETMPPYPDLVSGVLDNPIPKISGSVGTPIGFKVLSGDPTPYIHWIAPDSPVADLLDKGATVAYWHSAMDVG